MKKIKKSCPIKSRYIVVGTYVLTGDWGKGGGSDRQRELCSNRQVYIHHSLSLKSYYETLSIVCNPTHLPFHGVVRICMVSVDFSVGHCCKV